MTAAWHPTIGLEIHARLATRTKAFCRCEIAFDAPPNTRTCPVCLGYPGSMPVLSTEAVRLAVRSALAIRAAVATTSRFDRKNYSYPDLPKGYQITQAVSPIGTGGRISIHSKRRGEVDVRIERIHIEEDAGRTTHEIEAGSGIDFNRAGAPLVEIVTAPDLRDADEAIACFSRIRQILMWVETCDGNMEEGSIRCDANVSVSRTGIPGTRTETKNLNSFRFLGRAIEYEIGRQIAVLEAGGEVVQETLLYEPSTGQTRSMRSKEESHDYRFFPEPDLPSLILNPSLISDESQTIGELPDSRAARYREMFAMPPLDSEAIAGSRSISELFEELAELVEDHVVARNWVLNHVMRAMKERSTEHPAITAPQIAELIRLAKDEVISSTTAREVFDAVWGTEISPASYVEEHGLAQSQDTDAIRELARRLIGGHPAEADGYRAGRQRLLGFFVGLVMKETNGKADPRMTSAIVKELLEADAGSGE